MFYIETHIICQIKIQQIWICFQQINIIFHQEKTNAPNTSIPTYKGKILNRAQHKSVTMTPDLLEKPCSHPKCSNSLDANFKSLSNVYFSFEAGSSLNTPMYLLCNLANCCHTFAKLWELYENTFSNIHLKIMLLQLSLRLK